LPDGRLLVASDPRIKLFSPSGAQVGEWDDPTKRNEFFGLDFDADGTHFWVTDLNTARLYRFDLNNPGITGTSHFASFPTSAITSFDDCSLGGLVTVPDMPGGLLGPPHITDPRAGVMASGEEP
jgi:hypothetical protein